MKTCIKCGFVGDDDLFITNRNTCKICRSEYNKSYCKNYRNENKDKMAAYFVEYYSNNRNKRLAYSREYNSNNRDKISARRRENRKKNIEIHLKREKEYLEKNKDKILARHRERDKYFLELIIRNRRKNIKYALKKHITKEMIDAKRLQISILRLIEEKQNEKR